MGKQKARRGFVHLFFLAVVLLLLMVFSVLTSAAMDQKLIRKELEYKLKLDYATESYYLLIREGELTAAPGISYGDLEIQILYSEKPQSRYIQVQNEGGIITITGWDQGKRRGEYEIRK